MIPRVSVLVVALLLPAGALVSAERTTTITGRVELPREVAPAARRPDTTGFGMPPARSTATRRQSVVYLEAAPRQAFETNTTSPAAVDQRGETFVPHVLAVTAGTEVAFPNSDETYHNVFSLSQVEPFDLGRYAAGHSKSVRFDQPGVVRVFCDIHSHMSAFVLVFGHRFFAVTDEDGRYAIENVPPGRYRVAVWHELFEAETQTIRIADGDEEVELDFTLEDR